MSHIPVYKDNQKIYRPDSCVPVKSAAERGDIKLTAIGKGKYPGVKIPDSLIKGLRSVGCWNATRKQEWGLGWHRNEGLEIQYIENGFASFSTENHRGYLQANSMAITRPWQPHKIGNPHVPANKFYWIIIDVGVRAAGDSWKWPEWVLLGDRDLRELTYYLEQIKTPIWHSKAKIQRSFKNIFSSMVDFIKRDSESRMKVYINELLLQLLDFFRLQDINIDDSFSNSFEKTKLFLEEIKNIPNEEWTLEEMAYECGLGITQFIHYCKQITNMSPIQYITYLRLLKAKEMLHDNSNLSITDVALDCGFSSSQYFSRVFKRHIGVPPKNYCCRIE